MKTRLRWLGSLLFAILLLPRMADSISLQRGSLKGPTRISAHGNERDKLTPSILQVQEPEWEWQNPLPQGNTLNSMWGSGPNDIFAVGDGGTVIHHNGISWSTMYTGSDSTLRGVWGSGPADVFAVGDGWDRDTGYYGTILHYDGIAWNAIGSNIDAQLFDVWGCDGGDVFAVGGGGIILRYDGSAWIEMSSGTDASLYAVWGRTADDVYAVGHPGTILHYDGVAWRQMSSGTTLSLYGVWGSGTAEVFAVGSSGTILRYDGNTWTELESGTNDLLYDVWGGAPDDVFAVGQLGDRSYVILHYDGNEWNTAVSGTTTRLALKGVWGSSSTDVSAVGDYGTILHYDGSQWSGLNSIVPQHFSAIWGDSSEEAFAVGSVYGEITILQYNGTAWHPMTSPTTRGLHGIWGASRNDVFAVGPFCTLLHYDGYVWSVMDSDVFCNDLQAVWGSNGSDVFAVGDMGTILHYDGSDWRQMNSSTTNDWLVGVWGSGPNDVFAVGGYAGRLPGDERSTILHYDGSKWTETYSATGEGLRSVWGSGPEDVFAVGWNGIILHYDGSTWSEMNSGTLSSLNHVWGSGPEDVFAVGLDGAILHYDGSKWVEMSSGTVNSLNGVWGGSSEDVFAVGSGGTILHYGGGKPVLSISHIEVTQVIQDEENEVTLISGKPTFVRVYADCGEGCSSVDDVTGVLRGYGPSGEFGDSPLPPVNSSITAYHPDQWTQQRGDLGKTLNFTLPRTWRSGTITLTAEVEDAQDTRAVPFREAGPLRVVYVPIRYDGREPDLSRIQNGSAFAQKLYPTDRINYIPGTTINWTRCLSGTLEDECPSATRHQEQLLTELTSRYHYFNAKVFGWLPEGAHPGGRSDPPWDGIGKAAFGIDHPTEGQRVFAHEIGHLMGQRHTNTPDNVDRSEDCQLNSSCSDRYCQAYVDEKNEEWLDEFENSTIQQFGLDGQSFGWLASSLNAVKNPTNTYDFMSYCGSLHDGSSWTSPWTFEQIYTGTLRAGDEGIRANQASSPSPYIIVSGLVYTDDTVTLDPVWAITPTATTYNPPEGIQYCLDVLDSSATPLATRCFDLDFLDYATGEATDVDGFNLTIPYFSSMEAIVLREGSQDLFKRTGTSSVPAVAVLSPNGGESWSAASTYTVTWAASDADGDTLTYRVLYSPDGDNWVPVGSATTETQLAVDAAELAGGDLAKVRVMASDGINTTVDESDAAFAVEDKAPSAQILTPERDVSVPPGATILFRGYGYDLEDGVLGETAYGWASDRDGNLGAGSESLVTLSTGDHVITLAVTDSDGKTGTATVNVSVGRQVYLPVILRQ